MNRRTTTTYRTITLDRAVLAVKVYNEGLYGSVMNVDLDDRAHDMFKNGLGQTIEEIQQQVDFIGRDYGGVAGFKVAYAIIPDIAHDIAAVRDEYDGVARSAANVLDQVASHATIQFLYRPFVRPFRGKCNWKVWAAKFWHHLNPTAFLIRDSRVDSFFVLPYSTPVAEYVELLNRFRTFVQARQDWLPCLRRADGNADREPCSDNKLWDKMFYGVGDLDRAGR